VESASQPIGFIGYKRPDQYDKDDATFDVISHHLLSRPHGTAAKDLVRDKKKSHWPRVLIPHLSRRQSIGLFLFCWSPEWASPSTKTESFLYPCSTV
jgi:hypothetical protein